ncbi:hypothetical protein TWF173_005784 [Orbilia oligospora]|nr:hypothetical protein TWF173_005784 [Orbilia oligospora]
MYRNEADKPTPFSHKRFPRGKERQLDSSRDRSSRALLCPPSFMDPLPSIKFDGFGLVGLISNILTLFPWRTWRKRRRGGAESAWGFMS